MTMRWRLVGIVALSVGALLALAIACGLGAADGLRQALVQARDTHLVNTVQDSAESRLAIGLAADQLEALQPLIEREKAAVPEILSIDLFSVSGTLLYSTDRSAIGLPVSPVWVEQLARTDAWSLDGPAERTVGLRAENDIGEAALGVAVTLAKPVGPAGLGGFGGWFGDGAWRALSPERLMLVLLAAVCLVLAALTTAFACTRMLSPWGRVGCVLRGVPVPDGATPEAALERRARERHQAWAVAEQDIDQCLAELRAMDDGG